MQIKDAFKRMKAYYAAASVGAPGSLTPHMVPLEYEYEVQAMFPTLASLQAIGGAGLIKTTANTLTVKTSLAFNFKKGGNGAHNNRLQTLSEIGQVSERLEAFLQLIDHIQELKLDNRSPL